MRKQKTLYLLLGFLFVWLFVWLFDKDKLRQTNARVLKKILYILGFRFWFIIGKEFLEIQDYVCCFF